MYRLHLLQQNVADPLADPLADLLADPLADPLAEAAAALLTHYRECQQSSHAWASAEGARGAVAPSFRNSLILTIQARKN